MIIYHFTDLNEKLKSGITEVVENLTHHYNLLGIKSSILTINKDFFEESSSYEKIDSLNEFKNKLPSNKDFIIIFHSLYKIKFIKFYIYCVFNKVSFYIQPHGGLTSENYRKNKIFKFVFFHTLFWFFIKKAKAIIFLSQKEFQSSFKKINNKYFVIPNGINPFELNKLSYPIEIEKKNKKINFIFLGRIDINHKGLDILLDAFELLPLKIKEEVTLNIFGYGNKSDEKYLINRISLSIDNKIYFHGGVFGKAEKNSAFLNSDIFILTSRYEGMPISVLEAMSAGLPCLVSNSTNVEDIILSNKCGWVVDENKPENIARMIKIAIDDFKINKHILVENAVNCANNKYCWESIVKNTSTYFNN